MKQNLREDRLYTRYAFSAAATVVGSSLAATPAQVTNISFGGCRLGANGQLPAGIAITLKIYTSSEYFEAAATVVHSTANGMSVRFDKISPESMLVLVKWIDAAKST